jgi:hypothetical protein
MICVVSLHTFSIPRSLYEISSTSDSRVIFLSSTSSYLVAPTRFLWLWIQNYSTMPVRDLFATPLKQYVVYQSNMSSTFLLPCSSYEISLTLHTTTQRCLNDAYARLVCNPIKAIRRLHSYHLVAPTRFLWHWIQLMNDAYALLVCNTIKTIRAKRKSTTSYELSKK